MGGCRWTCVRGAGAVAVESAEGLVGRASVGMAGQDRTGIADGYGHGQVGWGLRMQLRLLRGSALLCSVLLYSTLLYSALLKSKKTVEEPRLTM